MHWPARSPDLTPLDFFLWRYVKETVYKNRPSNDNDLQKRIADALQAVSHEMLRSTIESFEKRIDLCIHQNGGHFQQFL